MWLLIVGLVIYCLFYFRRTSGYMDASEMRKKSELPPVDCVGAWKNCPAKCGETGIQTYKITTPAAHDGKECPFADTDTRGCTGNCD